MNKKGAFLFASTNPGKYAEANALCQRHGIELVSPSQFVASESKVASVLSVAIPNVIEDENSYYGNAKKKADAFLAWSSIPSIADDTGLEVLALKGAPGVHSARYAGPSANGEQNIKKLLAALDSIEKAGGDLQNRSARFVCSLVLALGKDKYLDVQTTLDGQISREIKGAGGFGYDSIFIVEGYGKTLAEIKEANIPVKTHRILALESLIEKIEASF